MKLAISTLLVTMLFSLDAEAQDVTPVSVKELIFQQTTSRRKDAQTNATFYLTVKVDGVKDTELRFPDLPHDEREPGRTDTYNFAITESMTLDQIKNASLFLRTDGKNAWNPSRFKIQCVLSNGQKHTILDKPWPDRWFSTEVEYAYKWRTYTAIDEGPPRRSYIARSRSNVRLSSRPSWNLMKDSRE